MKQHWEYFNVLIITLSPVNLYSQVYCKRSDLWRCLTATMIYLHSQHEQTIISYTDSQSVLWAWMDGLGASLKHVCIYDLPSLSQGWPFHCLQGFMEHKTERDGGTGTLHRLAKHPRWPMSGVTLSPLSNTNPSKPRDCMLQKSLTNCHVL